MTPENGSWTVEYFWKVPAWLPRWMPYERHMSLEASIRGVELLSGQFPEFDWRVRNELTCEEIYAAIL